MLVNPKVNDVVTVDDDTVLFIVREIRHGKAFLFQITKSGELEECGDARIGRLNRIGSVTA